MPRVSVITSLYNHERYIAQAIESVVAQTYRDWEHLIWDDGSTDGGFAVARTYAEANPGRIRVFTHPRGANRGQEITRNCLLEKASGEYLALLDSDDFYLPRKLELLVPLLADPRVGLAYGRTEILHEATGKRFPSGVRGEASGRVFPALVNENFVGAASTLFRRQCVSGGGFDAEFQTIGEYPLWLRIARDWRFAFAPETVSVWRDHGANLGSRLSLTAKAELVRLAERLREDAEYAEYAADIRRALARKRYDYAAELYFALKLGGARRECQRLLVERGAPPWFKAKAVILLALTALGAAPNRALSRVKRWFWESRRRARGLPLAPVATRTDPDIRN